MSRNDANALKPDGRPLRRPCRRDFERFGVDPKAKGLYWRGHAVMARTGALLTLWDGQQINDERWEGRWITRCHLHGVSVWQRGIRIAVKAIRQAGFCRQCREVWMWDQTCLRCGMRVRGCMLCVDVPRPEQKLYPQPYKKDRKRRGG